MNTKFFNLRKAFLLIATLAFCHLGQAQNRINSSLELLTLHGTDVIARSYDSHLTVMYDRVQSNGDLHRFTITDTASTTVHSFTLPQRENITYRFYDMRILDGKCYFCGKKSYQTDIIMVSHDNTITYLTIDVGVIGYFDIMQCFRGFVDYELFDIENTKSVNRMTVYDQNGRSRVAAVGTSDNENYNSCIIELLPIEGASIWVYNVSLFHVPNEVMTDIITTNDFLIVASHFDGDSNLVGLRYAKRDGFFCAPGDRRYIFDADGFSCPECGPIGRRLNDSPIRLCAMIKNDFAVGFVPEPAYMDAPNLHRIYRGPILARLDENFVMREVLWLSHSNHPLKEMSYLPDIKSIAVLQCDTTAEIGFVRTPHWYTYTSYADSVLYLNRLLPTSIDAHSPDGFLIGGYKTAGSDQLFQATQRRCHPYMTNLCLDYEDDQPVQLINNLDCTALEIVITPIQRQYNRVMDRVDVFEYDMERVCRQIDNSIHNIAY